MRHTQRLDLKYVFSIMLGVAIALAVTGHLYRQAWERRERAERASAAALEIGARASRWGGICFDSKTLTSGWVAQNLPSLETHSLELIDCEMPKDALAYLPGSLYELSLLGRSIDDTTIAAIAPNSGVAFLQLEDTQVSDAAVETLCRLPKLRAVTFWGPMRLTPEGLERLRTRVTVTLREGPLTSRKYRKK